MDHQHMTLWKKIINKMAHAHTLHIVSKPPGKHQGEGMQGTLT